MEDDLLRPPSVHRVVEGTAAPTGSAAVLFNATTRCDARRAKDGRMIAVLRLFWSPTAHSIVHLLSAEVVFNIRALLLGGSLGFWTRWTQSVPSEWNGSLCRVMTKLIWKVKLVRVGVILTPPPDIRHLDRTRSWTAATSAETIQYNSNWICRRPFGSWECEFDFAKERVYVIDVWYDSINLSTIIGE